MKAYQVTLTSKNNSIRTFPNINARDEAEATEWGEVQAGVWGWKGVKIKVKAVESEQNNKLTTKPVAKKKLTSKI
jgi:hypothetical protein